MRKIVGATLFAVFMFVAGHAQEVLMHLGSNPVKSRAALEAISTKAQPELPLTLPFREDFSYPGPYPDPTLWADSFAYVNSSFAVHPKTVGVATFDALDQYGRIYEHAQENAYSFVADHLTTHPIRLDSVFSPSPAALTPADSVLLTFYFQPQGRSSYPRERDSLVVEFLHTPGHFITNDEGEDEWVDDLWVSVWRAGGESLSDFSNDTFPYFRRVALPIIDPVYFREDFRFRFKNYSSFPLQKNPTYFGGNANIWNVDYITLDRMRSVFNTSYYDIAFAAPATTMLNHYTAMPWSHYIINPQSHQRSNFNIRLTNLGSIIYNYVYRYFIQDEAGNIIRTYDGGTWNIAPFSQDGYQVHAPHTSPQVLPNPLPTAPNPEGRHFRFIHTIREGATGDSFRRNDTIVYNQVFRDYFAYDDGVAEFGYGIIGFGQPRVAYRFVPSHTDTLEAVQIFFNQTLNNVNVRPFYLTVWSSLDPEEILYESEVTTPQFEEGMNQFTTYFLDEPVLITDTFYVGWRQIGNNDFLNVGFDVNNDASAHTFINYMNQWEPSIKAGAMMIRPFFGHPPPATSITDPEANQLFQVYPNPVTGNVLNIRLDDPMADSGTWNMEVYDMQGRVVYSGLFKPALDTGAHPNGLYFIRVTNPQTRQTQAIRYVIAR
jgi:hypothetical protein